MALLKYFKPSPSPSSSPSPSLAGGDCSYLICFAADDTSKIQKLDFDLNFGATSRVYAYVLLFELFYGSRIQFHQIIRLNT